MKECSEIIIIMNDDDDELETEDEVSVSLMCAENEGTSHHIDIPSTAMTPHYGNFVIPIPLFVLQRQGNG